MEVNSIHSLCDQTQSTTVHGSRQSDKNEMKQQDKANGVRNLKNPQLDYEESEKEKKKKEN